MPREHELKLKFTEVSVLAAIRYLDPELDEITDKKQGALLVIYASLGILVLGCVAFFWLWHRIP
jgi:hypothetical protein